MLGAAHPVLGPVHRVRQVGVPAVGVGVAGAGRDIALGVVLEHPWSSVLVPNMTGVFYRTWPRKLSKSKVQS